MQQASSIPLALPRLDFYPDSICYGADQALTVITAYVQLSDSIISAIKSRRAPMQLGEPTALIIAWDLEFQTMHLYCIDTYDTQSSIQLTDCEVQAIYHSLCGHSQSTYHHAPEYILNNLRERECLPALAGGRPVNPSVNQTVSQAQL